jgi:hypothetical protein
LTSNQDLSTLKSARAKKITVLTVQASPTAKSKSNKKSKHRHPSRDVDPNDSYDEEIPSPRSQGVLVWKKREEDALAAKKRDFETEQKLAEQELEKKRKSLLAKAREAAESDLRKIREEGDREQARLEKIRDNRDQFEENLNMEIAKKIQFETEACRQNFLAEHEVKLAEQMAAKKKVFEAKMKRELQEKAKKIAEHEEAKIKLIQEGFELEKKKFAELKAIKLAETEREIQELALLHQKKLSLENDIHLDLEQKLLQKRLLEEENFTKLQQETANQQLQ